MLNKPVKTFHLTKENVDETKKKVLADIEENYNLIYDPALDPCGKQTLFIYQPGLTMQKMLQTFSINHPEIKVSPDEYFNIVDEANYKLFGIRSS